MLNYKDLSDLDLINNIKQEKDVDDCLKEITNRHSGIFYSRSHYYFKNCGNRDDVAPTKDLAIYTACLKFDETKGSKFSTYLANEINWACLTALTKDKKKNNIFIHINDEYVGEAAEVSDENDTVFYREDSDNVILKEFSEELIKIQDPRIKRIFHLRYFASKKIMPWRLIAKDLGLSTPGCIWIHNQTLSKIKDNLVKKHECIFN